MKHPCLVRVAFAACLITLAQAVLAASVAIDKPTLQKLAALRAGEEQRIAQFPVGASQVAAIRIKPTQIYSDNAHIIMMTAKGAQELPRSPRVFLRGVSDDGSIVVGLAVERDGRFVNGTGNGPDGSFVLSAQTDATGAITLTAQSIESALPPGFKFDFKCGNEDLALSSHAPDSIADQLRQATSPSSPAATATTPRYATVALDTDSLFMSRLFSNNTTNATNWIASMFNTINTMYEADLNVHLQIGTVILRTSSANDPYTSFTPGATTSELSFFGNYWETNEASVTRSFAALLSGQESSTPSSCSASGIAWIDAYCNKGQLNGGTGQTFGSYSVDQVCTSINIDPSGTFNARIVGHEIGHNFGAFHTHCTDVSNGNAPVATNTIDQCYAGEAGIGCYAGTTSCPSGGKGTIMSYCNIGACAGTQNLLQFASTQITDVLLPDIAANTPSCLSTVPDEIFANGFE